MTFPEFGDIIEKAPPLKEPGTFPEFGKVVEQPSRLRSIAGAPIKGALKEVSDIAEFFQKIPLPKGNLEPEKLREFAEEKFPTQEKELEGYLERVGKMAPSALISPGGPLIKLFQILGGAALGHGLEKAGAPEWVQALGESAPFLYSGGKKIPFKSSQKKVGDFLRKQGLSENEITPLLKTPEQLERWSKFASKGKKSRQLMESIYHKSGHIYDNIENIAKQMPNAFVNQQSAANFLNEITPIIQNMPNKYRNLIKQDLIDLIQSPGHFNDFTNFYKDVNAVIGAEKGGRAIVGQFKGPILKIAESINPELANDFALATDLYRTRAKVAGNILSKKDVEHFLDLGEIYGLGSGIYNRDIGLITKVLGIAGGRKLAREMVINPRLQNISIRIGEALKKNKLILVNKLMDEFKSEVQKEDPELAQTMNEAMTIK